MKKNVLLETFKGFCQSLIKALYIQLLISCLVQIISLPSDVMNPLCHFVAFHDIF